MGIIALQAQVTASYDSLGMPSWPNPHPELESPRDEDYSRVTDPERYRIVHARARVWSDRLADLPGVEAEALAPAQLYDEGHPDRFDRGVRLTSARPGTLPLLLLEYDMRSVEAEVPLAVLKVCVVRPEIALATLPDCGCDACDSGSADLLDALDQTIRPVIDGPLVVLRGDRWHAQWHPDGDSSGGTGDRPDHAALTDLCRRLASGEDVRLPKRTEAFVGHPWL
jgi:hypothetical protein